MATGFTDILKLALPVQGELSGTWGTTVNDNITKMVEEAIAGSKTINTWVSNSATLSTADGTTAEARAAILNLTDTTSDLTGAATLICPALTKVYIVKNATGQAVTIQPDSASGIAIPTGTTGFVYCDGTNVVEAINNITGNLNVGGNLTVTGTATISGSTLTANTAFVPDAADGATLGTAALEFSDLFLADGGVINFGNDQDVTLTHVADTGLLLSSTDQLQFGDSGTYIHQSADGVLDLVSDTEIEINATTIDMNGAVEVSGAITGASTIQGTTITATTAFVPDASDGAALGTAALEFSDLFLADGAVINFGADQDVSLTHVADTGLLLSSTDQLQFGDSGTYIHQSADGVLDLVSDTEIEINATTIDMNGALEVSGAITGASTVQGTTITATTAFVPDASDGAALGTAALEFSDLFLADGAVINFGNDQDVSLTHVADTGLLLSSTDQLQFGDSGTYIHQSADGVLDLVSDTEIEINATTIDINGAVDISGNALVSGEVQTANIGYTDGDNAITIADGGGITAAAGITSTAASNTFGATSFNDANITNVGNIALDSISADGTDINLAVSDNSATAFTIKQGSDAYLIVDTANSSESVSIGTGVDGTAITLGHSTSEVTVADNLTVTGDLTINGTTTTVNSTTVTVDDPIFTLGGDTAPGSDDNKDRGIEFRYHDGSSARIGFFGYDDSASAFTFLTAASNSSEVFSGTAGNLAGVGTIASGAITSSGIIKTDDTTEATSTTDGSLQTDGGLSVAKDAVFGDDVMLLSDSAVLKFGADSDTTLTHTDGTGLTLNSTNKLCFNDATQFIQGASGTVLDIAATDEIELTATLIDVVGNLAGSGTGTFGGILKTDDATDATTTADGSLQTDGGLSVVKDVILGNDVKLLSDSAVLSLGAGNDITFTHDGTTGLTIAATPISIDSTGELHLNSTIGDIKLQDGGVDQIAFDLDGTSGEVIMKPAVDSDDLVISQYDGTEVIRVEDNGSLGLVGNKLSIANSSSDVVIKPLTDAKDIIFQQYDGTVVATVEDNGTFNVPTGKLAINSTAITSTAAEINLIDGGTSRGTTAVASGDGILINDAGTMRMTNVDTVSTYFASHTVGGGNIVTTGALNSGSITSGFGTINNGSSAITTTGTITYGSLSDGTITITAFADEDDMSSDSATLVPTQQSVKAYVDNNAGSMTNFYLEDGDGTEVTVSNGKEVKFVEGGGIDINWTDTSTGSDGDPYDLTFTIKAAQTDITSLLATDIKIGEDDSTKIDFGTANAIIFNTDGSERFTMAADGKLNAAGNFYATAGGDTAFFVHTNGTQRMKMDSGRTDLAHELRVSTTGTGARLNVKSTGTSENTCFLEGDSQDDGHTLTCYSNSAHSGNCLRVYQDGAGSDGYASFHHTDANTTPMYINRNGGDGNIIDFAQGGTVEGAIVVSGSTVTLSGFTGAHWSRLIDNSKPTILRGTVVETLDEMCDWYHLEYTIPAVLWKEEDEETQDVLYVEGEILPDGKKVGDVKSVAAHKVGDERYGNQAIKEPYAKPDNKNVGDKVDYDHEGKGVIYETTIEQTKDVKHVKCKISDTADCKNVYGIFWSWDNDDDTVNDMYVNSVGTSLVRIHKDQTVSKGDLLTSNGDGTAKKQSDDIIRSKTIGKVLSNKKQETYSDGSYVVPCALYCG